MGTARKSNCASIAREFASAERAARGGSARPQDVSVHSRTVEKFLHVRHHSPLWLTHAPIPVVGGGFSISRPCRLAVAKRPDRSLRSADGVNAPFICAEQMLLRRSPVWWVKGPEPVRSRFRPAASQDDREAMSQSNPRLAHRWSLGDPEGPVLEFELALIVGQHDIGGLVQERSHPDFEMPPM
jgi:hypothetical protein